MPPVEESLKELEEKLNEALDLLEKKDVIQASEKLYWIAERVIKKLAEIHNLPEHEEASRIGRWTTRLLENAAKKLKEKYGEEFYHWWETAYDILHIRGFHEGMLTVEEVRENTSVIEQMLNTLKREMILSSS